jgi:D-glycero-alpha-D-manno-heptose-7-phosphate kinase
MRDKHTLATESIHIEQDLIQEAVGAQDQTCAAYGGFNRINFHTDGSIEVKRMLTSQSRLAELEQNLALYFTGFSRTASEIATEQLKVTPHKKSELNAMYQLVSEAESIVADPNRPLDDFGKLLHESWKIKRTLTQKITTAHIDEIYAAGLSAGALGGKLLGAGGGGFMLFYVPPEKREILRNRLKKLLCVPFAFSDRGSQVVVYEPEKVYDSSLVNERREVYPQSESYAYVKPIHNGPAVGPTLG